jgi:diadenosine tetraphosphate (Ap4A) HIT family hydrolase
MNAENETCVFCNIPKSRITLENDQAFAIFDGFPITPLHGLIIPKRHVEDFFGITDHELLHCRGLIEKLRQKIVCEDPSVDGFNIGINAGASAGQTIFHCHIHLIPRRIGDVENPRGGVRHLIPGKGFY